MEAEVNINFLKTLSSSDDTLLSQIRRVKLCFDSYICWKNPHHQPSSRGLVRFVSLLVGCASKIMFCILFAEVKHG